MLKHNCRIGLSYANTKSDLSLGILSAIEGSSVDPSSMLPSSSYPSPLPFAESRSSSALPVGDGIGATRLDGIGFGFSGGYGVLVYSEYGEYGVLVYSEYGEYGVLVYSEYGV
jgi:hypothetical protein